MNKNPEDRTNDLPTGVMFNAYPDSIGEKLADTVALLRQPELKDAFSLFYILPTFFNSDLDRGFSVIDYDINQDLISAEDLAALDELGINFKFDLVLNHLSVGSPQFRDLLEHGDDSPYKDFFIDWNEFWREDGEMGADGVVIPNKESLDKLFMRKPGLPILRVCFPDGSRRLYWNTFYQQVTYPEFTSRDFEAIDGIDPNQAKQIAAMLNDAISANEDLEGLDFDDLSHAREAVLSIACRRCEYLGQMDLNARSELVWDFYDDTLGKLRDYGAKIIRLDAFAYLHKQPGEPNFFNRPGTWEYLERLRQIAREHGLIIFPEVHAEYGTGIHREVASEDYPVYDFFFPGLVIDALDRGTNEALLRWANEILDEEMQTINMLGCHDGIPVLDLKGKHMDGEYRPGLLDEGQIDTIVDNIMDRGGRVKNLYGPDGRKIAYYQVNATFFSALGEDEQKLRLARAIQMFMPGIPQVWYLDLFAGRNDYEAADKGGVAGHKEINRTTLSREDIEAGLQRPIVRDQLELIRLRNRSPAFQGEIEIHDTEPSQLHISWQHPTATVSLRANLKTHEFDVVQKEDAKEETLMSFSNANAG